MNILGNYLCYLTASEHINDETLPFLYSEDTFNSTEDQELKAVTLRFINLLK